jgi:hypothetical protein
MSDTVVLPTPNIKARSFCVGFGIRSDAWIKSYFSFRLNSHFQIYVSSVYSPFLLWLKMLKLHVMVIKTIYSIYSKTYQNRPLNKPDSGRIFKSRFLPFRSFVNSTFANRTLCIPNNDPLTQSQYTFLNNNFIFKFTFLRCTLHFYSDLKCLNYM